VEVCNLKYLNILTLTIQSVHPRKLRWNLKRPEKGKGETSTQTTNLWVSILFSGVSCNALSLTTTALRNDGSKTYFPFGEVSFQLREGIAWKIKVEHNNGGGWFR